MEKGLDAITNAYKVIEHIAVHGWQKRVDDDGEALKGKRKRKGSALGHDPVLVAELNLLDKKLRNLADKVHTKVVTRENEVQGCIPHETCYGHPVCGNLIVRQKHVRCKVSRITETNKAVGG